MTLQEQLDAHKKGFVAKAPKEALEIMHAATDALVKSGQAEKARAVGRKAPEFSLKDTAGQTITLSEMLPKGPVVLAFYRGKW